MKQLLFILTAVVFSLSSFAQKGLQVGLLGGPTSNWLINKNDSDDPTVKLKTGGPRGVFGLSVDYHFINTVGVGLEFDYAWQGQAYDQFYTVPGRVNINYLKIPLVINFNTNPEGHVAMFVGKVGPYLAVNTAGKFVPDNSVLPTGDIKSQFTKINAGILLGLGVGFNIKDVVIVSASLRLDGQVTDPIISNSSFTSYGTSKRDMTWNVSGGLEIGAKYIIPMGGSSSKSHSKSSSKSSYHRK